MNDHIQPDGSDAHEGAHEHDHGALGDAEYAEFMELAAEEGFDRADVEGAIEAAGHGPLPVVAVVGRPNVGKSTLVNRIIGRREAVVEDKPGVTRDRVTYEAEWAGRRFKVVDTGGWEQDVLGIDASVAAQAEYAIEAADAVVFVVDAKVGATDTDEAVVRLLRKAGKPVVLCANKVDGPSGEADAAYLWSLGLGEPYPVSALHGRGTGDMLDQVLEVLPEAPRESFGAGGLGGPRRVALIGRPNVGKSSLLNKVAGEERVVVDELAGTTRDPVDELIELGGVTWKFVDTAGIRKRVHLQQGADYYASLRTAAAVEKAEVAVVLIDASESISVQDQRIITMAVEAGRALVLAFNKWDTLDEERRFYLEREIETELGQVSWAPRVNVSARTGRHMEKLVPAIETALAGWETRVPTGRLNAFLGELVAAHPHPIRGGKQPRILFGTQAGTKPPRFVLFASGFIEAGYRRFIERRLREEFGFEGTPIHISVRVREKRGAKKK
ncbi:ribosome biogenesis GTPase Der [Streptomyces bullii]|uniref:GTPase Der n=1 Tax=Streptomyces bullii TaxID=349910 RepID=A0ABW0UXK8_9ACTN